MFIFINLLLAEELVTLTNDFLDSQEREGHAEKC